MLGWILYKSDHTLVKQETYEIERLVSQASSHGIDIRVYTPEAFDLMVTRDDRTSVMLDGQSTPLPDFFLPRMGAGTNYFALAVIRHLERLGVHSFNSAESIDTVKDKLYSHQILAQNGLPVPKTMLVKFPVNPELVKRQIGFPVVVKTLSGSQGSGVFLCETLGHFEDLMQMVEVTNPKANIILQEFIADSRGRDLRVIVIGGRAVACMERVAEEGSFKANFSRGASVREFSMTPEVEWLAIETARVLGLEIAGVDLLFDGDHYKVCEANSSPGFEGVESCCDVDVVNEIYHFLRIRLGNFQ
ncbi:ATP-grasp domain-containing protein [Marinobacterium marinum]|uniref:RimK family alpha-L-glutamate ligase n=1 Tax=Marinobacterium marinum TaxID=2756129 RepID=A0A7W1WXQ3_9GAMM|nr:RimK family alpha-L-glutamate ligase [Marinobacterium marinum]MBA4502054.1 RimK family alpha-L-glutamate ligase [Marinobacterium marinum]